MINNNDNNNNNDNIYLVSARHSDVVVQYFKDITLTAQARFPTKMLS